MHDVEDVVADAHDGQCLVNVQMTVAAHADVPSAVVPGVAKHHAVARVGSLGRWFDIDVGPRVLKPGGHDDGAGPDRLLGRIRAARGQRRRRHRHGQRAVRGPLDVRDVGGQPANADAPRLPVDGDLALRLRVGPLLQRPIERRAGDAGEHRRVHELDRLRPEVSAAAQADGPAVDQCHVARLMRGAHGGLGSGRTGSDNQNVKQGVCRDACHKPIVAARAVLEGRGTAAVVPPVPETYGRMIRGALACRFQR